MRNRILSAILIASMVLNSTGFSSLAAEVTADETQIQEVVEETVIEETDSEESEEVDKAVIEDTIAEETTDDVVEEVIEGNDEIDEIVPEQVIIEDSIVAAEAMEGFCGADEDGENIHWELIENTDLEEEGNTSYTLIFTGEGEMSDEIKVYKIPWLKYNEYITQIQFDDEITTIFDSAFAGAIELSQVSLPANLEYLGVSAFEDCESLKTIELPEALLTVNESTFELCTSLESVTLGSEVLYINKSAFDGCKALKELVLPEKLISIGNNAFQNSGLTTITFPTTLKSVGYNAFSGCTNLEEVNTSDIVSWCGITFDSEYSNPICYAGGLTVDGEKLTTLNLTEIDPDKEITKIGNYTFANCGGLNDIYLHDGITALGNGAFKKSAKSIIQNAKIYIPKSVRTLGISGSNYLNPFDGWTDESRIYFECNYNQRPGMSMTATVAERIDYGYTEKAYEYWVLNPPTDEEFVLDEDIDFIPSPRFTGWDRSAVKSITVPSEVTFRAGAAKGFSDELLVKTDSLEDWFTVNFEDSDSNPLSVTKNNLVADGDEVTSLVVPETVEIIKPYVFYGSTINGVSFHDGVKSIGKAAFKNCNNILSVYVPSTVGSMDSEIFYNDVPIMIYTDVESNKTGWSYGWSSRKYSKVPVHYGFSYDQYELWKEIYPTATEVEVPAVTEIPDTMFGGFDVLEKVKLPSTIERIGDNAFGGCVALKEINFPESLVSIGDLAFAGCELLSAVKFNDALEEIGARAFKGCSSLKNVEFGESLKVIGDWAFAELTGLQSFELGENLETIGEYAFEGCSAIEELAIPDSVTSIGAHAFDSCMSLSNLNIGSGIDVIPESCFTGCSSLAELEIPDTVLEVGVSAFEDCTAIENLVLPEGVVQVNDYAFKSCSSLAEITLPDSLETLGKSVFANCGDIRSIFIPASVTEIAGEQATDSSFYGIDSTMVIYCECEEDPIPEGWGKYWNYCSATEELTVYYGYSREKYLEECDYDSRDDEDYMDRGKIDLGKLWTTENHSIVITPYGYYIGDPDDEETNIKKVETTEPITLTGNAQETHGNSIVFQDNLERTIVLDHLTVYLEENDGFDPSKGITPFIQGNGKITFKCIGENTIGSYSSAWRNYGMNNIAFIQYEDIILTGAGTFILDDEGYTRMTAGNRFVTENFTGDLKLYGGYEGIVANEIDITTPGDLYMYSTEKWDRQGGPLLDSRAGMGPYAPAANSGNININVNAIYTDKIDKKPNNEQYSTQQGYQCILAQGIVDITAKDSVELKGTGISARQIKIETGEGGLKMEANHSCPVLYNQGLTSERVALDINGQKYTYADQIRIISGGDIVITGGGNYPFGANTTIEKAQNIYIDVDSIGWITNGLLNLNIDGDFIVGKNKKDTNDPTVIGGISSSQTKMIVGGSIEVYAKLLSNPLFNGSAEIKTDGKCVVLNSTYKGNGSYGIVSGNLLSVDAYDDIIFDNFSMLGVNVPTRFVSHTGKFEASSYNYFVSSPFFTEPVYIEAEKDINLDCGMIANKGLTAISHSGGFNYESEASGQTVIGGANIKVAKDIKFHSKRNISFSGGEVCKLEADNIFIFADGFENSASSPMFLTSNSTLSADHDININFKHMICSGGYVDIDAGRDVKIESDYGSPIVSGKVDIVSGRDVYINNASNTNRMIFATSDVNVKALGNITIEYDGSMAQYINSPMTSCTSAYFEAGNMFKVINKSETAKGVSPVIGSINVTAREILDVRNGKEYIHGKWTAPAHREIVSMNHQNLNGILKGSDPENYDLRVVYNSTELIPDVDYKVILNVLTPVDEEGNPTGEADYINNAVLLPPDQYDQDRPVFFVGCYDEETKQGQYQSVSPQKLPEYGETIITATQKVGELRKSNSLKPYADNMIFDTEYRDYIRNLETEYKREWLINESAPNIHVDNTMKNYGITNDEIEVIGSSFQITNNDRVPKWNQLANIDIYFKGDGIEYEKTNNLINKKAFLLEIEYDEIMKMSSYSYCYPNIYISVPIPEGVEMDDSLVLRRRYRQGVSGSTPSQPRYYIDYENKTAIILLETYANHYVYEFANKVKEPEKTVVNLDFGVDADLLEYEILPYILVTLGEKYGPLPKLSLADEEDNRVFLGWFTKATGGEKVTSETIVTDSKTHTLYAQWQKSNDNLLLLKYDLDGGSFTTKDYPTVFQYRKPYQNLPVPIKEGYAFVGWFDAPTNGVEIQNGMTVKEIGEKTLYAYWKKIIISVEKPNIKVYDSDIESHQLKDGARIALSCDTDGAEIYYTLDGSDPTVSINRKKYENLITVSENICYSTNTIVIRACAELENVQSEVLTYSCGYIPPVIEDNVDIDQFESDLIEAGYKPGDIPNGLWMAGVEKTVEYKGSNWFFDIRVYNGAKLLTKNKDYTEKYINNKNAGTATIEINGKGSYIGKASRTFTITPIMLGTEEDGNITNSAILELEDIVLANSGRPQYAKPVATVTTCDGKILKLTEKVDYTLNYPDKSEGAYTAVNENASEGYTIELIGTGKNYVGKAVTYEAITDLTLVKSLAVSVKDVEFDFAKAPGTPVYSQLSVKNKKTGEILAGYRADGVSTDADALASWETADDKDDYSFVYYLTDNMTIGTAKIHIIGLKSAGYAGTITKTFKIKGRYISKAKYAAELTATYKWREYNGEEINPVVADKSAENASLKYNGVGLNGIVKSEYEALREAGDSSIYDYDYVYSFSTDDRASIGTVAITFEGVNGYSGSVIKKYKIAGTSMTAVKYRPFEVKTYGDDLTTVVNPDGSRVVDATVYENNKYEKAKGLNGVLESVYATMSDEEKLSYDYCYTYLDLDIYGKQRVQFTGINGFTGTKVIKIPVVSFSMAEDQKKENEDDRRLIVYPIADTPYTKGGVTPEIVIFDKATDRNLVKNVDYKLTYKNNNPYLLKDDVPAVAKVIITGKGNYKDTVYTEFNIVKQDISKVSFTAVDVVYKEKANICKPTLNLVDTNGKKLQVKTDYVVDSYKYVEETWVKQAINGQLVAVKKDADEEVETIDIIPVGAKIEVTVNGRNNYLSDSTATAQFRYVKNVITSAKVTIPNYQYTGSAIYPEKSSMTVKVGTEVLAPDQFEIIDYTNNINKGTAKVTIQGRGNYSGTRVATFKITSLSISDMNTGE